MTARILAALSAAAIVASFATAPVADDVGLPSGSPSDAAIRRSRDRGVERLVAMQQADGSWGSGGFRGSVAVTANAVLALVAAGSTPTSGPHAEAAARGVAFLLESADDDGLFDSREPGARGPMYGQAYTTLVLAELLGEIDSPSVPGVLARSAALFEATQNDEGGWRYQPKAGDADVSVTSAVVVALAALEKSGIAVSRRCVERAVAYLRRLQNDDGGFRYQASAGESAAPRTAAAIVAMFAAGESADDAGRAAIARGIAWLERHPIELDSPTTYSLYGAASATAAFWQAGGEPWNRFFGSTSERLLALQQPDGSWPDPSCPEYGTAAAVMTLSVPDGLIPVFQP